MPSTIKTNLINFKLTYSEYIKDSLYKHTKVNSIPPLHYNFKEGNNWLATDIRVKDKFDSIYIWFDNYWNIKNEYSVDLGDGDEIIRFKTNQYLYEQDLEKNIRIAIENTNEKWTDQIKIDFENEFEDKLVRFIKSKKD